MPWLEPVSLRGAYARLEPLSHDQSAGLTEAVKDGELWKLWYTFVPKPEEMTREIDRRLGLQAANFCLGFFGKRFSHFRKQVSPFARVDDGSRYVLECRADDPLCRGKLQAVKTTG